MAATMAIGKRWPADRGDGEQVCDLTGQPGKAAGQHVTHRRRDTGHRGPVQRRTLRREQPRDLLGEERVPGGAVVHGPDQRRRRPLTAHLFDQLANLIGRQAGELQQLGLTGQLGQQPARGMIPAATSTSRYVPTTRAATSCSWRARKTSSRSDDMSAQCRSSTTTTSGRCAARPRRYVAVAS